MMRTIRNLLKKPVFEKGKDSWINELSVVIKEYNNTIHSSKNDPIKLLKNQRKKKSIPIIKLEELDNNQKTN